MVSERIHIESPDGSTVRGRIGLPVSLSALPDIVRAAVASSKRFSIVELDESGAILASRSNFASRALLTDLEFDADDADVVQVRVRCRSANPLGFGPGLQYRMDAVTDLLEAISFTARHRDV